MLLQKNEKVVLYKSKRYICDTQYNLGGSVMDLQCLGRCHDRKVYKNLRPAALIAEAVKNGEGTLAESGALVVNTGKYTGRSPKDRFIVKQDSVDGLINWGEVNLPIEECVFNDLYEQVVNYLNDKNIYVFEGYVGALKEYSMNIRVINEYASEALMATQLFRRYSEKELRDFKEEFTVIVAPGFKAKGQEDGVNSEAFIIINFEKKIVLIGGTQYSGEIKKSIFSIMNFLLPQKGVFPMHCSANIGKEGDTAVFFGLSGTGKTTLSADPGRKLIGDDEHGWCDKGVFNFEGGCYAKTIKLDKEKEVEIYNALKFGALLENVVLDEYNRPMFDDDSLTENTRGAYPLEYIENMQESGVGGNPNTIIFLTADAFGVIPPISKLSKEAAMYHFMSGYTSKLAGTERGITKPKATFSACFGEPFMLMKPEVYAKLLGEKISSNNTEVYLVNTGWSGGEYGVGKRMNLSYTRAMVKAAIEGDLREVEFEVDKNFNVFVPKEIPGVPGEILNPRNTWNDKEAYDKKVNELILQFQKNFRKFEGVSQEILQAAPGRKN